jgi:hypothetical protein
VRQPASGGQLRSEIHDTQRTQQGRAELSLCDRGGGKSAIDAHHRWGFEQSSAEESQTVGDLAQKYFKHMKVLHIDMIGHVPSPVVIIEFSLQTQHSTETLEIDVFERHLHIRDLLASLSCDRNCRGLCICSCTLTTSFSILKASVQTGPCSPSQY